MHINSSRVIQSPFSRSSFMFRSIALLLTCTITGLHNIYILSNRFCKRYTFLHFLEISEMPQRLRHITRLTSKVRAQYNSLFLHKIIIASFQLASATQLRYPCSHFIHHNNHKRYVLYDEMMLYFYLRNLTKRSVLGSPRGSMVL